MAWSTTTIEQRPLQVAVPGAVLDADLSLPPDACGLVLFAHGSGSSRHSPRNRHVARVLNEAGLATVLADLLTHDEELQDQSTAELRFDIGLLSDRLVATGDWLHEYPATHALQLNLFGASTGAAAALVAAGRRRGAISAVVSRGGRPDLAGDSLTEVLAPTLLIVGGEDVPVITLNRQAYAELDCEKRLAIVPGASHLFEEAGALDAVAQLARDWFIDHLPCAR
jgi:pimeloyl-ACP methyl ester carboxylesterase